jgi:hypothetical protein
MSKKTFSVDDTLYRAQAKKLVKQLKLDETKFVREQAGMLAQNFASITPPFVSYSKPKLNYGTKKDIAKGKEATRAGFYSVVKMMTIDGQNWKDKNIRSAIERGDMNYVEQRLKHFKRSKKRDMKVRQYSDNRRNKQRNSRGRAYRDATPFVTLSRSDAESGLARAMDRVGMAKASFARAAQRLGRKKPIKDIFKHFSKVHAVVTVTRNPSVATFTVSSHGLDQAVRREKEVTSIRLESMVKRLKQIIKADAKKAGFKTR